MIEVGSALLVVERDAIRDHGICQPTDDPASCVSILDSKITDEVQYG